MQISIISTNIGYFYAKFPTQDIHQPKSLRTFGLSADDMGHLRAWLEVRIYLGPKFWAWISGTSKHLGPPSHKRDPYHSHTNPGDSGMGVVWVAGCPTCLGVPGISLEQIQQVHPTRSFSSFFLNIQEGLGRRILLKHYPRKRWPSLQLISMFSIYLMRLLPWRFKKWRLRAIPVTSHLVEPTKN